MAFPGNNIASTSSPLVPIYVGTSAGGDLTGTYPNPLILSRAVTSDKIAVGAVNTVNLATASVTYDKLSGVNFLTSPILLTSNIGSGIITNAHISNNAFIATSKLAEGSKIVFTYGNQILSGIKVFNRSPRGLTQPLVGTDLTNKIYVDNYVALSGSAVSSSLSGSGSAGYISKYKSANSLANSVIFENAGKIGIANTSPSEILHVTGNFRLDGSLVASQGIISGNHIISRSILTGHIANNAVSGNTIATDSILQGHIANDAVGSNEILNSSISGNKIAANSVLTGHLANNSVTSNQILNASISGNKIAANSILTGHIADGAVGGAQINAGYVLSGIEAATLWSWLAYYNSDVSANSNNWKPDGNTTLPDITTIRVTVTGGSYNITGLSGGTQGRYLIIHNIDTSNSFTLVNDSTLSIAANRFYFGSTNSSTKTVGPNCAVHLRYDSDSLRWRVIEIADQGLNTTESVSFTGITGTSSIVSNSSLIAIGNFALRGTLTANHGIISGNHIIANSILQGHLANNSVGSAQIINASISGNKIQANSILTGHIAANAVTSTEILNSSISGNKIAANSVLQGHLATNSVGNAEVINASISGNKIAANSILTGHIADNAITSNQILNSSISGNKIAANSILTGHIAANAVTSTEILNSSISGNKIAANSILTGHIANDAVTSNQILNSSISGNKIAANSILTGHIANDAVTSNQILNSSISGNKIAALSLLTGHYADGSVTNAKLADSAVSGSKIQADAVLQGHIGDNAVGSNEIINSSISGNKIAANSILQGHLADNSVGSAQIINASISGNKIQANSILYGHIGSLLITELFGRSWIGI